MGYCVDTEKVRITIPTENLQEAYEVMCELNNHNELKRGGSYSGGKQVGWHFSWMNENYPNECSTAEQIIQQLGFDTVLTEEGLDVGHYLGEKIGQEDVFFSAIGHLVQAGSYAEWYGEDGERWKWDFNGDGMEIKEGQVVYD